jgi:hypothetical protein
VRSNRRALAAAAGLAAVAAYLAGAAITNHLNPHAGKVLFDGFAPPPPYRWVSPPPALAASNEQPAGAAATVPLTSGGSDGASVLTPDSQASLFLVRGAFPPRPGQRSVHVEIQPSAPPPNAELPGGFAFDGNVYVFTARYEPGGDAVTKLAFRSTIVLVYPAPLTTGTFEHVLLSSGDGRVWTKLTTSVADLQHQAAADVGELGFYAVGRRDLSSGGGIPQVVRIGVFGALLVAAALIGYLGWRRRRPA